MITYNAKEGIHYGTNAERLADTTLISVATNKLYEYDTGILYVTDGTAWTEKPMISGTIATSIADPVDVFVQNQTTDIVDYYLCRELFTLALATDAVMDSYTLTLVDGSSVVNDTYICIQEGDRAFQGQVLSGGGTNTVTLDTPVDYEFTVAGSSISNRTPQLAVNGSVTVQIGTLSPGPGVKWDITRINGSMLSAYVDDIPSDIKFSGITALTRGIVLRKTNGVHHTIFNAKTNGDLKLRMGPSDVVYNEADKGIQYGTGFRRTFGGDDKNGVVVRLDGDLGDELQILIQDDLTSLDDFRMVAQGHVVKD